MEKMYVVMIKKIIETKVVFYKEITVIFTNSMVSVNTIKIDISSVREIIFWCNFHA